MAPWHCIDQEYMVRYDANYLVDTNFDSCVGCGKRMAIRVHVTNNLVDKLLVCLVWASLRVIASMLSRQRSPWHGIDQEYTARYGGNYIIVTKLGSCVGSGTWMAFNGHVKIIIVDNIVGLSCIGMTARDRRHIATGTVHMA